MCVFVCVHVVTTGGYKYRACVCAVSQERVTVTPSSVKICYIVMVFMSL